jgi:menaquinone-dependent protoporphyrinogen oxidase
MARVLILYVTSEGHTGRIAGRMAACLEQCGIAAELHQVKNAMPDAAGYDGIIVGASVHYGHHPARLRKLVRAQRAALAGRAGAFFSVCLSGKAHYREKFLRQCGWAPAHQATFTGALQYSKYGPFKRLVVMVFAWMGGHDTDASKDYDYTNWKAVDSFATAFSRQLR